ncbi:MAG: hypothetical protein KBC43_01485 [Bacteroidales bacterium]|nr:hypothetical protein [Bacteroidales bacterium]
MIVEDTIFEIEEECDETCYLNGILPLRIQIQLSQAQINFNEIYIIETSYEGIDSLMLCNALLQDSLKVNKINAYIILTRMPWIAGSTIISKKTYSEKKNIYGNKYKLYGFDYYIGGIFNPYPLIPCERNTSPLVPNFDWRKKHNAHKINTFYFDNDFDETQDCNGTFHEHGNGWMTKVKDQDPLIPPTCQNQCEGCCYIFSTIGVMEAMTNLYFNHHYDLDLSEQYALNCSSYINSCDGGISGPVFGLAVDDESEEDEGIIDESSAPWQDGKEDCNKNLEFTYRLTYLNYENDGLSGPPPIEYIKEILNSKGPLKITLDMPGSGPNHDVVLVGYGILQAGDVFHTEIGIPIYVDDFPEYIGSLYWVCKNSYGPGSANGGYFNFIHHSNPQYFYAIKQFTYIEPPIYIENNNPFIHYERHCYDNDNDGYYNWGIGDFDSEKCNFSCDNQNEDSNDDNDRIGPVDENYFGTPIFPVIKVYYKKSLDDIYIEPNSFISFSSNDLNENDKFRIYIQNTGDAQLNLYPVEEKGKVELIDIPGGSENYSISEEDLPEAKVCMGTANDFQVTFTGTQQGELTKVRIYLDENDEIPDFEFILVYNDCQTSNVIQELTGNIYWSSFALKPDNYLVKSGAKLYVTGEIALGNNSNIYIAPGGELILDGGRLTSSCGSLWKGIDVWGDRTKPQLENAQGIVRVRSGGIIEHAKCGIENLCWYEGVPMYTGGIFDIVGAEFKDNQVAVKFWPYHNINPATGQEVDNFSRIRSSEFRTTQNLYDLGFTPQCFISMTEVKGVKIVASLFINETLAVDDAGVGIYATAADFTVDHYCPVYQVPCPAYIPCHFENLEYGIHAGAITSAELVWIRNSEFINNKRGIYLSAYSYPAITQNIFEVRKAQYVPFYDAEYCGLYLDNCTQYDVEENNFYTFLNDQEKEDLVSTGLTVNNSGIENNIIYNNIFDGLYNGIIAQEVNRDEEGNHGLQLVCNNFMDDVYDIAVTHENEGMTGIAKDQGFYDPTFAPPAGNRFSLIESEFNPEPEGNFYNDCESITYYFHSDTNGYYIIPRRHTVEPPLVDPQQDHYNQKFIPDESCPSSFSGGGSGILLERSNMMLAGEKADSTEALLTLLTDGGDTEGLLSDIQFSWPEEGYALYSDLMTGSPYLSDTTMIKAVEKEDVLLPGMITDVLVANPQSAKSDKVMNTVDERSNPLTDDQMADIGQGRFITGAKESLESRHAAYLFAKDLSKSNIIRSFKADTLCESQLDSIISILNFQPELSDEYRKAFEYFAKGDSLNVINTLDEIPLNHDLNDARENEHSLYEDYFDVLSNPDTSGSLILKLDSAQKTALHYIVDNSTGILKAQARNILILTDSLDYSEPIILPQPGLKSEKVRFWPEKSLQSENSMKIYPNPAKNIVIIEIRLKEQPKDALINIIDNKGIILKFYPVQSQNDYLVIPLNSFSSGTILCQMNLNNNIIETKKLLIIK